MENNGGPLPTAYRNVLLRPWFAMLVTVLIIFTGLLGSIYSPEIRNAFPFYWGNGQWSWRAFSFWLFVCIAGGAYFLRESAQAREQWRIQNDTLRQAEQQASEFTRLIRTLPPKNFLTSFSTIYGFTDAMMEYVRENRNRTDVEMAVRHILRMIAILTQKFDGDDPSVEYAANIMHFRAAANIPPAEHPEVRKRLLFCDESVSIEHLAGILDFEQNLSTTANSESAEIDATMGPLALMVPLTYKSPNGRWRVLPGAPIAYVERRADLYWDTSDLAEWCAKNGDFTQAIIEELSAFFRVSPVKGFVSIPLFALTQNGNDEDAAPPIAILNVHCNRKGLLAQGESFLHLIDIIRPFRIMLVKLLAILQQLDAEHPSPNTLENPQN